MEIKEWCFKINENKTKHMNLFGKDNLKCKIKKLENATHIKFLGVTLDHKGDYEEHMRCITLISLLHKLKNELKISEKNSHNTL